MKRRALTLRWRLVAAICIVLVRVGRWRIDVQGLEHVPSNGGAVVAFNHHSYNDFVMLAWGPVRSLERPIRFLAKREIWRRRRTRWVVRWVDAVPVDRSSASARSGAFDAAADALRRGDLVGVAPEQTISESFELLPFRTGAVRMAQLAGVPIVPVVGWGSHRFATKGQPTRLVFKLPVTVRFGPPMRVAADDDPVRATERLRDRMTTMLHDVQESYPDGAPDGAAWVPARLGGSAPPPPDRGSPVSEPRGVCPSVSGQGHCHDRPETRRAPSR